MAILCWQMLAVTAMMADPTIPVAPAPAVDLDPRAEGVRLALAVLGGHGWTDRMLWYVSAMLEAVLEVQQERDG